MSIDSNIIIFIFLTYIFYQNIKKIVIATTSGLILINDSTIIMTYLNTNLPKRLIIHRIL